MEPLLNPANNRLTIYPIKFDKIWHAYKEMQASNWTAEEVDFSTDLMHYENLSENEQHFIKMILAFFAASDTIVNINLSQNFTRELQIREAIVAYEFQTAIENVHSECYSLMIDNIIKDSIEKDKCFNAIKEYECIREKAQWAINWTDSKKSPFAQRLIAFAIVEGVFFSGSFCAIFWLKKKNLMPGLCMSNELIARDEGMHTNFACLLYSYINNKISELTVHKMFQEAIEIERKFICESLPCSLLGMNNDLMYQYIKFCADHLLVKLGYKKIWMCTNPFDFMESLSLEGKTNFFESRPTQYQNSHVLNKGKNNSVDSFQITEDF
jgi:ribonucleotide reductase beta subunit family protein with ferritin-like domain